MYNRCMSNTTKFYDLRDRYNRYKKTIKKVFQSKYYTDSSKSGQRRIIAQNIINNAISAQTSQPKQVTNGQAHTASSLADPQLHVRHRLNRPNP